MITLGRRLRKVRESLNLTQKEAASRLSISNVVLNRYEHGERQPTPDALKDIADKYNVSVDYLLGRTNDPTPHKNKTEEEIEFEEFMKNHTIMYQGVPMTDEEKESINEFLKTAFKILRNDEKPKKQEI